MGSNAAIFDKYPAKNWVNGEWVSATDDAYFEVFNPLDGTHLRNAARANADDLNKAIEVAHQAFLKFRKTPPRILEAILSKVANLIEERREEFVNVLIDEVGSPIAKARFEVQYAIDFIRACVGMPRHLTGRTMTTDMLGRMSMSIREPIGVVASIPPFNVPLIKGVKLTTTAIATGNTVVALPSRETPTVQLLLAEVFKDAGCPNGVYNVVSGYGSEIGDVATTHPKVKAVMFTGSSRVGKHIAGLAGGHMKRMLLELGGKGPLVVLKDADLDAAAHAAAMGCFFFQGQGCMVSSRIYVEEEVMEPFLEKLKVEAENSGMGDLRDMKTFVGPAINERQLQKVSEHVEDARAKGATVYTGGEIVGTRYKPTILTNVDESMVVCKEETFGPVTSVYPINDLDDGIAKANDTAFGLSAAIFTKDINKAMKYVNEIESGMVHVNAPTFADEPHVPFSGIKDSGFGTESTIEDLDLLTENKWVTIQLPNEDAKMGPQA